MARAKISSNPNIDGSLKLDGDPDKVSAYYRDWAETYDRDVAQAGYTGPQIAVDIVLTASTCNRHTLINGLAG